MTTATRQMHLDARRFFLFASEMLPHGLWARWSDGQLLLTVNGRDFDASAQSAAMLLVAHVPMATSIMHQVYDQYAPQQPLADRVAAQLGTLAPELVRQTLECLLTAETRTHAGLGGMHVMPPESDAKVLAMRCAAALIDGHTSIDI